MASNHSLEDLKRYHSHAMHFFDTQLCMLAEVLKKITDERLGKCSVLLLSCGQTGTALLQLASQTEIFGNETMMLSRAFMEKITNFVYAGMCDEKEYRAFVLHPVYKNYHAIAELKMEDDLDEYLENKNVRKEKQEKFKEIPIVREALAIFSETKANLNWTKKTLNERIAAIEKWGKLMDVFFTLNKIRYYSDASETLHGSLYGCIHGLGVFDPEFDNQKEDELEKKLYKDSACVLLHLGMLVHESFTLIKYTNDIEEIWNHSYDNRGNALNLLMHILEKKTRMKN